MPNSNRQRGDYLERQTRAALEAHGWYVQRSGGSLGVADLVALRAGNTPLLVQCKLDARMSPAERLELVATCKAAGARPIMAARTRRGWVDIYLVRVEHGGPKIDEIKVPARPGKPDE